MGNTLKSFFLYLEARQLTKAPSFLENNHFDIYNNFQCKKSDLSVCIDGLK